MSWQVEKVSENVHTIRFDDVKKGWKHSIMLSADRHHDNIHSLWALERQHLDRALEVNAPVIDIGDLFCAMQGKYDPRADRSALRKEHQGEDYFDQLINTAADFYSPYADIIAVMGKGNHETSTLKHHQLDLTNNLARRLREASTRPDTANTGGYGGWVMLRFQNSTRSQTLKLKYHHGYGGGGPVTKGVIQANRRAVYLPDADFIVTGHIHEGWSVPNKRERVSERGVIYQDNQWHISVPTYKDEYASGFGGFHIEKGRPPKPTGCVWLHFESLGARDRIKVRVELDCG